MNSERVGGSAVEGGVCVGRSGGWGGGVDGAAAIISLKAIGILLSHYNSNHRQPPDEIFIRDWSIEAFLITIC